MSADDARYERPCRWLLATAAGIHWIVGALIVGSYLMDPGGSDTSVLHKLLEPFTVMFPPVG